MAAPSYRFGVSEFTTNPWTFAQDVEAYARLGVSAIEVCEAKLSPDRVKEQMALVGAHGLTISSVQPATRTLFPSLSQTEPKDPAERMQRFRDTIARLAPWTPGVPFVTNTGMPPGGDIQAVLDTAAREYRAVAEFAADHGVRIAFEPLSASIMNIETAVWTLAQGMEIVRAVDRENFGICLDTWNIWQNADIEAEIRACGEKIFIVQVSDWRTPRSFLDRHIVGQGVIPHPALLRAIHEAGYRGTYAVEIFSSGVPGALWEADLTQVIQDSRAGLDAAWRQAFPPGPE